MLLFILAVALFSPAWAQQQPIDFPHNKHVDQGLACVDCHSTADTGTKASLPSVSKCMLCHEKVATEGPGVTVLRQYAEKKRELPWARVYGFHELAFVKFRHAPHVRAGIECAVCHGEVAKMTVAKPVVKHTMGTCVSCHRENKASDDCVVCHY